MKNSSFEIKPFILLFAAVLFISFCIDTTGETLKNPVYLFLFISLLLVFLANIKELKKAKPETVYIIIMAGILLKLLYVLYTAVWTRQHDVIDFGTGEGHAGYIEYIYFNNTLPGGDPRDRWAFFQPPLHHIIAALWMKVCNKFMLSYRQLQENIQAITLFYTSAVNIISVFICRQLKLKKNGMLCAMLLISFHPVFVIMSGSINNDALSLCFMVLALYLAILWSKKPSFGLIILLALSIGLSMFAKLSGGLIAPAAALLFLVKLIKEKGKRLKLILQYLVFGLIVFPLGIGWEIRNMLMYGMPFNYIPPVGEQLQKTDLFSRLFDFRLHSVYPSMINNGDQYDEYNLFLAMLKTSLFDDENLSLELRLIDPFAVVLFISGLLLVFICLYATVRVLAKPITITVQRAVNSNDKTKSGEGVLNPELKVLLGGFYFTMVAAYLAFALGYSNYSAQSFRYIAASVITEALFLGIYVDQKEKGKTEGSDRPGFIMLLCIVFAVFSSCTYILLGFAR